jgi:hypothetical protein
MKLIPISGDALSDHCLCYVKCGCLIEFRHINSNGDLSWVCHWFVTELRLLFPVNVNWRTMIMRHYEHDPHC